MRCDFTLRHYRETLQLAKDKGYIFPKMKDYEQYLNQERVIFLRHDIDIQLKNALNMSEIENSFGISATYFVRLHADYNPFSVMYYPIIKKILEQGHEIGLHHEVDFAILNNEDKGELFKRARQVLEAIIGERVCGVAPHEPTRTSKLITEQNLQEFDIGYEAYSPFFLTKNKYISDSSCNWREGCMCNFIISDTPRLSILTHPIWWYTKSPIENY
jgi:hypothetical protein